jgi:hypothetical protein
MVGHPHRVQPGLLGGERGGTTRSAMTSGPPGQEKFVMLKLIFIPIMLDD